MSTPIASEGTGLHTTITSRGEYHAAGISLRDHFAGLAMQGWLASWHPNAPAKYFACENTAKSAYGYADAMIEARKGGQGA